MADQPLAPILTSVEAAANAIGVSRTRMYELCNEGAVESRYQGARRLVVVKSLHAYADQLPTERPEAV